MTTIQKMAEAARRIRTVIDGKNLRERQQRIYEIRSNFPDFKPSKNLLELLKKENLNWE